MGTYYQRSSQTYPNTGTVSAALATNDLSDATAASDTVTRTAPSQGVAGQRFLTDANVPNLTSWAGSLAGQWDVTAVGASITYRGWFYRVSSSDVTQQSLGQAEANFTGTGLKAFSNATGFTTASSTERLRVECEANNSNMMSVEDITLRVNTTDSYVTVPWDVGAPPTVTPLPKVLLSTVPSNAAHRSTW